MAFLGSWSAFSVSSNKNIPQLLKAGGLPLTLCMYHTRNKSSASTLDQLRKFSNPFKPNEFVLKPMSRSHVEDEYEVKHAELVKRIRKLITEVKDDGIEDLRMVDALQRLQIDYLFEDDINLILERHFFQYTNTDFYEHRSLHELSLCFRILRQNGFHVSADAFETFKGKNGKFKEKLKTDMKGLMELYEASQLCIEGESVLDEAAHFSCNSLEKEIASLDDDNARMVRYTLGNPPHRSLSLFNVKNSIKDFKGTIFEELADLDFIMVQRLHQMELHQILRWWKDLGLTEELNVARDQPLKCYLWPMAALTNPSLSKERVDLAKTISLIYTIDDIFDLYGTLDELTQFTQAIRKWDINSIEKVPYYMRKTIKAIYDTTNEIANKVYAQYGFNPTSSLRKSWETLCEAFLVETKWFTSGQLPKAEEYLKNGIVSSGVHVVLVHMFFLLGDGTTKERACLIDHNRGIISSVSKILRLWDDLGSAQDENQEGYDGSYIKCFLKEHEGCSIKIAREHVFHMIESTWKGLNEECLSPNPFSTTFTKGTLNMARMIPLMYSYNDFGSLPLLDDYIEYMLCKGL